MPCKKCGEVISFRLTPDTLADAIRGRPVTITCLYCSGFRGRPYRFKIGLGEILWHLTYGWVSAKAAPEIIKVIVRKVESDDKGETGT